MPIIDSKNNDKMSQADIENSKSDSSPDSDDIVLPEFNPEMEQRLRRIVVEGDIDNAENNEDFTDNSLSLQPTYLAELKDEKISSDVIHDVQNEFLHPEDSFAPEQSGFYDSEHEMDPQVGTISLQTPLETLDKDELETYSEADDLSIPWRMAESERSQPLLQGVVKDGVEVEYTEEDVVIYEGERITTDFTAISHLFPPDPTAWTRDAQTGEVREASAILPLATSKNEENQEDPSSVIGSEMVIGVKLREYGPVYFFRAGQLPLKSGHQVLVATEQGTSLAYIITARRLRLPLPKVQTATGEEIELAQILGLAKAGDIAAAADNKILSNSAKLYCKECIRERELDMKLVDVEVLHDRSTIIFYFTAPSRIDFRELVKDLVRSYRTRIELRQIGVRHETQMLGAVGNCGMTCCCRRFLRKFAPVTIKMAKEQNLFLNPAKLSGICGRLLCCLAYEQENYEAFHKRSPKIGKRYNTSVGPVKILRANLFKQSIFVLNDKNEENEFSLDDWCNLNPVRDDTYVAEKNNSTTQSPDEQNQRGRQRRHNKSSDEGFNNYTMGSEVDDSALHALEDKPEYDRKSKRNDRPQGGRYQKNDGAKPNSQANRGGYKPKPPPRES